MPLVAIASIGQFSCMDKQQNATNILLVTEREAARMLAVSPRTLFALRQSGELKAVRIGRTVRYSAESLRAFIAAKLAAAD